MRVLWLCPTLLHPTINGSQIRTLGILRHLSRRHEIHFVGLARTGQSIAEKDEYCAQVHAFTHDPPRRGSFAFALAAAANVFSRTPINVARYASRPLRRCVARLLATTRYDAVVVDFLASVPNMPSLERALLFEHNVEGRIMERLAAQARSPLQRYYLSYLSRRLNAYERSACRRAKRVLAVSSSDVAYLTDHYDVVGATAIPTGVDVAFFARPHPIPPAPAYDLIFVGSMDYLPNINGIQWFAEHVLPLIAASRPGTTVGIVGKNPAPSIERLARQDGRIHVTRTVPDIRPYLWQAGVSVVPLLAGSGTRLKIYEAMAAGVPVVSTTVGAEGLQCTPDADIVLADEPRALAAACVKLLDDRELRTRIACAGQQLVRSRFDWSEVAARFEDILDRERDPMSGSTGDRGPHR